MIGEFSASVHYIHEWRELRCAGAVLMIDGEMMFGR